MNIAGLHDVRHLDPISVERTELIGSPCFYVPQNRFWEHENSRQFFTDPHACETHYSDGLIVKTSDGRKRAYIKDFKWDSPGIGWGSENPAKLRMDDDVTKRRTIVPTGAVTLYDITGDGNKVLYIKGPWMCTFDAAKAEQDCMFKEEIETYDYIGNDPLRRPVYSIPAAEFCDNDSAICFQTTLMRTNHTNAFKYTLGDRKLARLAQWNGRIFSGPDTKR
jgi:hypothetical protein